MLRRLGSDIQPGEVAAAAGGSERYRLSLENLVERLIEFGGVERLAYEGDFAKGDDFLDVGVKDTRGEENDGQVGIGRVGSQFSTNGEPAQAGHHDVADEHVRSPVFDGRQGIGAIGHGHDVVAVHIETELQEAAQCRVILGHENFWSWHTTGHLELVIRSGSEASGDTTGL